MQESRWLAIVFSGPFAGLNHSFKHCKLSAGEKRVKKALAVSSGWMDKDL